MFSKTVFKQTLKSNYKLWLIFTAIMSVLSAMMIAVFDPQTISSMMEMIQDSPIGEMAGDQIEGFTSLLGMLGTGFYGMIGVILPMIFIIITANSLIASQVDRGSMAYTLSTPVKRSKVVITQAIYMITSVIAMILVVSIVGLTTVQIAHGVFGTSYTEDVKAVSEYMDLDEEDLDADLKQILEDEEAVRVGAQAREIDPDIYRIYLNLTLTQRSYEAAADVLDIDADAVEEDPSLILNNDQALRAAANVLGLEEAVYQASLEETLAQQEASTEQAEAMQNQMLAGLSAAADELGMEVADLSEEMEVLKTEQAAMDAAVAASAIPEETWLSVIDQQIASAEISLDAGVEFELADYLMLNLGLLLLLFAISSISFACSCIFNLSKNSMALGAGIPIAFFIFQIMAQTGESLEGFKYLSLNTLFDPSAITGGGTYGVQFAVLGAIGVVLYVVGIRWFEKKDLPL